MRNNAEPRRDGSPLRLLGLSIDPSINFAGKPGAKNAGLFAALHRRYRVVGAVRPEVPWPALQGHRLRSFHPVVKRWRQRFHVHPSIFAARSAVAEEHLSAWEGRFDLVVQLHTLVGPGLAPGRRPYVLHTDNTYLLSERHHARWAPLRGRARDEWVHLEGEVYRQAAYLFPRSEWLRRSLIDDYGCAPERVIPVGGGANLRLDSLDQRRWNGQTALFVGVEWERKGGPDLLRAWESVRRALPRAVLRVVGIPRRPRRLPPGVEWLGLVRDRARMRALFSEATVFVMPSRFEPWGHVFYEAMGCGAPCIGADCCAMPEIISPETGLLVPPRDPDSLAEALVSLLGQPDRARAMGEAAWRSVARDSGWDSVVERMAPYIEAAVGAAPAPGAPAEAR